jgi:multidrug resistance efflux pump
LQEQNCNIQFFQEKINIYVSFNLCLINLQLYIKAIFMKRKSTIIFFISLLILVIVIWFFYLSDEDKKETITVNALQGKFLIDVTTTGELEARSSENILGPNPMKLRNARIWQYRIEDIVPNGTVVDSGDWVATLDRSDLENKIKDQELEVEKYETQFIKTQLDTTMTMRAARDELINLQYTLEEKQIIVDQSIYEPPATQRQVQLDLKKTKRTYEQTLENYSLKLEKAKADMKEVAAKLAKAKRKLNEFNELKREFVIHAPKAGMVNYKRGFDGKKQGAGAQISAWDNVVATLPNLSAMNSKTFINEIDISKVREGQHAEIEVDAFPGKHFTGMVSEVANMGEQLPNSNAKVFEVIIHINEFDSILRPSMTTKNKIITKVIDNAVFIPIECVHTEDSLNYVFKKGYRQQVITGKSNETDIIILAGVKKDEEIYLVAPDDAENWKIKKLPTDVIKKYSLKEPKEIKQTQPQPQNNKFKNKNKHKPEIETEN